MKITYSIPIFNGAAVEVWECIILSQTLLAIWLFIHVVYVEAVAGGIC